MLHRHLRFTSLYILSFCMPRSWCHETFTSVPQRIAAATIVYRFANSHPYPSSSYHYTLTSSDRSTSSPRWQLRTKHPVSLIGHSFDFNRKAFHGIVLTRHPPANMHAWLQLIRGSWYRWLLR
jgi:hypothetical protein